MFVHFLYQALCANIRLVKPKTSGKYAFDIVYEDDSGSQISTTNNKGYYVYFRKISNGSPQGWEVLKDMGKIGSYSSDHEISVAGQQDSKGGSIDVYLTITNPRGPAWDFDLGVYCDADFDTQSDNVKLIKKFNGNGVAFQSTTRPMTFNLKGNLYKTFDDNQSSDVDSIYTGSASSSELQTDIANLMLKSEFPSSTQDNQDSALAFSWKNRKSLEGRFIKLGFKVIVGESMGNVAPTIKDLTPKEKLNQKFTLKFQVTELDNQKVTVMVNDLIQKTSFKCGEFQSDGNSHTSGTVTCERTFNDDGFFKYNAYASDSDGANSSTTPDTQLLLDGVQPPICNVLTLPLPEYTEKDKIIYIEYEIDDENSANVSYQFDDMEIVTSENKDTSAPDNKLHLTMNIQIPSKLELNKPHILHFWATDNLGKNSFINDLPFKYSSSVNKPTITDIYVSTEKVENGKTTKVVVFGEATDPNEGDLIRIFAKLPGLPDKELGNVTATKSKTPFAFFFEFPSKEVGHYNISFYAKDINDHMSEENRTLPMIVWNPSAPQSPDLIGKIIDASDDLKADTNALFNLKYQDIDGFPRKMTFNDEGFFCAVRTFNDTKLSSRLGQYYFKKNKEHLAKFDDFVVRYEIVSNEDTKFLETKIIVRNEGFFPRLFELSLFADSDFSDDDNSPIISREDGRGIVVSSEKNKVRYTVFTQDYFSNPPVTRTFITNNLQRPNNNEIRLDDIPFFNTTKTETGQANSAYAVSWMSQVIPAQKEVSFILAFAAHDNVKTPPRLIDYTNWKDSYSPDEEAFINISIRDAEPNEKLNLYIFENKNYYTDSWTTTNNNFLIKKMNFSTKEQRYVLYIYVDEKDASTGFPSNLIQKSVSISGSPVLTLDKNQFKSYYHNKEKIKINGTVYDDNAHKVKICYRFIKGSSDEILSAEITLEEKSITPKTNNSFYYEIDFNKIYPSDEKWGIVVYAVDNLAVSNNFTHHFNLNVYSPPKLIQAGLSRKSASKNSRILAYAVLNDKQNDFINIFVKISGSDYPATPVHHLDANPTPGEDYPIAFHWQVPSDAKVGAVDVTFLIKDSEGLDSNEITKTLVITGN